MSRFGYRRVHVMRMGEAPVREAWVRKVVPDEVDRPCWAGYAEGGLTVAETREEGLDVYHLWLHWYARELVRLQVDWA